MADDTHIPLIRVTFLTLYKTLFFSGLFFYVGVGRNGGYRKKSLNELINQNYYRDTDTEQTKVKNMATNYANGTITHIIPNEPGLPRAQGIDTFYARPANNIIEPYPNDPVQRRMPFDIFQYQRQLWILNNPEAVSVITDSHETDTDDDVSKYTLRH